MVSSSDVSHALETRIFGELKLAGVSAVVLVNSGVVPVSAAGFSMAISVELSATATTLLASALALLAFDLSSFKRFCALVVEISSSERHGPPKTHQ